MHEMIKRKEHTIDPSEETGLPVEMAGLAESDYPEEMTESASIVLPEKTTGAEETTVSEDVSQAEESRAEDLTLPEAVLPGWR